RPRGHGAVLGCVAPRAPAAAELGRSAPSVGGPRGGTVAGWPGAPRPRGRRKRWPRGGRRGVAVAPRADPRAGGPGRTRAEPGAAADRGLNMWFYGSVPHPRGG